MKSFRLYFAFWFLFLATISARAQFTLEIHPIAPGSAALVFTPEVGYYYSLEAAPSLTSTFSPLSGWMLGDGWPAAWPLSYPTSPSGGSGSPAASSNTFAIYPFDNGKTLVTWTDGANSLVRVLVAQDYYSSLLPPTVAVPASGSLPGAMLLVGSLAWDPAYELLTAGLLPPAQQTALGQLPSPAAAVLAMNTAGTSGGGVAVDAPRQFFRLRRLPVDADGDGVSWVDEVFRFGTDPDEADEWALTREDLQLGVAMLGADAPLFRTPDFADLFAEGSEAATAELMALRDGATYRPESYGIGTGAASAAPPSPPAPTPSQVSGLRLYSRYKWDPDLGGVAVLTWDGNLAGRTTLTLEKQLVSFGSPSTWQQIATFPAEPREYQVPPAMGSYDTNYRLGSTPYSNETVVRIFPHTDWVKLSRSKPGFVDFSQSGSPRYFRRWREFTTDLSGHSSTHSLTVDLDNRRTQWRLTGRAGGSQVPGGQWVTVGLGAGITKHATLQNPTTTKKSYYRQRESASEPGTVMRPARILAAASWNHRREMRNTCDLSTGWSAGGFSSWDRRAKAREIWGDRTTEYDWHQWYASDPLSSGNTSTGGSVSVTGWSYPHPCSWPSDQSEANAFLWERHHNTHPTVLYYETPYQASTITLSGEYTTEQFVRANEKLMPDFSQTNQIFNAPYDDLMAWGDNDDLHLETRRDLNETTGGTNSISFSAYNLAPDGYSHSALKGRWWLTSNDCLPVTVLVATKFQPEDWNAPPEFTITQAELGQGKSIPPAILDPLREGKGGATM